MKRCFFRAISLLLATVSGPLLAAQWCETVGSPRFSVLVEPGELAGIDRNLAVALYPNGCVSVQLPKHYQRARRYVVLATATERALLAKLASAPELLNFSPALVAEQIATANRSPQGERFFYVADADRFSVRIRDSASGKLTTLQYDGATQYAEHYPEVAALQHLAAAINALLQYAAREDLIAQTPQP